MSKSLFDIDESTLSENGKKVFKIYSEIFGGLPPDKLYILNQMCSMFEVAKVSYIEIASIGKYSSEIEGICNAGCLAEQVMVHYAILKESIKCSDEELIDKIEDTSNWLKSKGWYGIPEPTDANGCKHIKTAAGLISDMKKYIDSYKTLQKQCEEMKKLKGDKK